MEETWEVPVQPPSRPPVLAVLTMLHVGLDRHVRRDEAGSRPELLDEVLALRLSPPSHDDGGPLRGKQPGSPGSDAARPASDHRDLALECDYSAAKAAVIQLTRSAAVEDHPTGFMIAATLSVICPCTAGNNRTHMDAAGPDCAPNGRPLARVCPGHGPFRQVAGVGFEPT